MCGSGKSQGAEPSCQCCTPARQDTGSACTAGLPLPRTRRIHTRLTRIHSVCDRWPHCHRLKRGHIPQGPHSVDLCLPNFRAHCCPPTPHVHLPHVSPQQPPARKARALCFQPTCRSKYCNSTSSQGNKRLPELNNKFSERQHARAGRSTSQATEDAADICPQLAYSTRMYVCLLGWSESSVQPSTIRLTKIHNPQSPTEIAPSCAQLALWQWG